MRTLEYEDAKLALLVSQVVLARYMFLADVHMYVYTSYTPFTYIQCRIETDIRQFSTSCVCMRMFEVAGGKYALSRCAVLRPRMPFVLSCV